MLSAKNAARNQFIKYTNMIHGAVFPVINGLIKPVTIRSARFMGGRQRHMRHIS